MKVDDSPLDAGRPFPGLRPLSYSDQGYFFGRTDQVFSLYRMIDRSRFIATVGASGSGKSSLVFAGLRPLLEKESREAGGRAWVWRDMTPGDAPLDRLVDLVHDLATADQPDGDVGFCESQRDRISYLVRLSRRGLVDAIAEIAALKGKTLLLLVDQFEELFRYATSGQINERAREAQWREDAVLFVQLLLEAGRAPDSNIRILLTMRSDFIGECARFHGLPEAVSDTQFLVPSPTRDQREQAIRGPIAKAGATIDAILVEQLLNDSSDEFDQLPVLQHCLSRLWERATAGVGDRRHLTREHYREIGGLAGALSQHANEVMAGLAGLEPVIERVFRALCEIDRDGRATRRALLFSQLAAETGSRDGDLRRVIDRFRSQDCSFLTSAPRGCELGPESRIDVGHEALLRRWERVSGVAGATGQAGDPRQVGWLRQEQRDGQRYQVLLAMVDGEADGAPALGLDQVERNWDWWQRRAPTPAWAARYGGGHDRVKRMLDDGRAALEASRVSRRRARIVAYAAASMAALLLFVSISAYFIYQQYQEAHLQAENATANSHAALRSVRQFVNQVLVSMNYGALSVDGAMKLLQVAEETVNLVRESRATAETLDLKINVLLTISDILSTLGYEDQARGRAARANELAMQFKELDPSGRRWKLLVYASEFRLGDAATSPGLTRDNLNKALRHFTVAQRLASDLLGERPEAGDALFNLAFIDNKVGETLQGLGDFAGAFVQFNAALALAERLASKPSSSIEAQAYRAITLTKIGMALAKQPRPDLDAALDRFSAALREQIRLVEDNPTNDIVQSNLARTRRETGEVYALRGELDKAHASYSAALQIFEQLSSKDVGNVKWLESLGPIHQRMGDLLKAAGDLVEARMHYLKETDIRRRLTRKDPTHPAWKRRLENAENRLAALDAQNVQMNSTGTVSSR